MQKGALWYTRNHHTQRLRRTKKLLLQNDVLHLYYNEKILSSSPPQPELLADEDHFSIWYKPYGLWSQGSKWGDHFTINRCAEKILKPQRSCFIVHRLDRAANGLMILAHSKKMTTELANLFRHRKIKKQYQAIVQGRFADINTEKTITSPIDGKNAISRVFVLDYNSEKDRSLVQIQIDTGRKHQIRRHLSEQGNPIIGDRLYGDHNNNENQEDLSLTSCYLEFTLINEQQPRMYSLNEKYLPKIQ